MLPLAIPGEALQGRAYDVSGLFLGLVEAAPGGGLRVVRLFVSGASGTPAETA